MMFFPIKGVFSASGGVGLTDAGYAGLVRPLVDKVILGGYLEEGIRAAHQIISSRLLCRSFYNLMNVLLLLAAMYRLGGRRLTSAADAQQPAGQRGQ